MKRLWMTLLTLLASFASQAGPLEDWAGQWKAGTVFNKYEDYADLYATTTDREFITRKQVRDGDLIIALYEASVLTVKSGQRDVEHGVAVFYLRDGRIVGEEHVKLEDSTFDLALTGQIADVASTAVGLAAGFAEGNPVMAGAAGSPGGLVVMLAMKVGLASYADNGPLQECVDVKRVAAGFGWGAAAWNLGLLAGGPVVGLVGGLGSAFFTSDRKSALRTCALLKLKNGPSRQEPSQEATRTALLAQMQSGD
jgi:hypothetical protein